jgi:HEAT repeat protein
VTKQPPTRLEDLLNTLASGDDSAREAAALELGRLGAAAVEPLATMLAHAESLVLSPAKGADARWWAARALAETGSEAATEPLIHALVDADPDLRACAALALGRIGSGAAAPALAARLADESTFVAGVAADALTMIGPPAVEALTASLQAQAAHTRLLAVRALGRIGDERAIGPLCGILDDPSYLVRHYAEEALEALGVGMVYLAP